MREGESQRVLGLADTPKGQGGQHTESPLETIVNTAHQQLDVQLLTSATVDNVHHIKPSGLWGFVTKDLRVSHVGVITLTLSFWSLMICPASGHAAFVH